MAGILSNDRRFEDTIRNLLRMKPHPHKEKEDSEKTEGHSESDESDRKIERSKR